MTTKKMVEIINSYFSNPVITEDDYDDNIVYMPSGTVTNCDVPDYILKLNIEDHTYFDILILVQRLQESISDDR